MPVLTDWSVSLNIDDVLIGQGADPSIIRQRSPRLIPVAERALADAKMLIHNVVVYKILDVQSQPLDRLVLADGHGLQGDFIKKHLANVQRVYVGACTISGALEERSAEYMKTDPVYGMALDGAASSAIHKLTDAASERFSAWAAEEKLQCTVQLSPGMIGWPVQTGQKQIFDILADISHGIHLTESCMMRPLKSISFVIGIAPEVAFSGGPCQFCPQRATCAFRKNRRGNEPCSA